MTLATFEMLSHFLSGSDHIPKANRVGKPCIHPRNQVSVAAWALANQESCTQIRSLRCYHIQRNPLPTSSHESACRCPWRFHLVAQRQEGFLFKHWIKRFNISTKQKLLNGREQYQCRSTLVVISVFHEPSQNKNQWRVFSEVYCCLRSP